MEYRVVEIKWGREGSFFGTPPIQQEQSEISDVLNKFEQEGWQVGDLHHEVGDNLRFTIVTLTRG